MICCIFFSVSPIQVKVRPRNFVCSVLKATPCLQSHALCLYSQSTTHLMVQGCLVRLSSHRGGHFFCELWFDDFFFPHACTVVEDAKKSLEKARPKDSSSQAFVLPFSSTSFSSVPLPPSQTPFVEITSPNDLLFRRIRRPALVPIS